MERVSKVLTYNAVYPCKKAMDHASKNVMVVKNTTPSLEK